MGLCDGGLNQGDPETKAKWASEASAGKGGTDGCNGEEYGAIGRYVPYSS